MSKIQLPKHRLLWLLVIVAGLVCADPAEPVTEPETENAPEPLEVSETLEASEQPVVQSETSEKVFNKNQKYTLAELKDMYNADLPSNPPAFLNTYAWELLLTGEPSYQHSAYNIFTYLAESYGLPSAQHGLAFMYMNGIGINSLEETASEDELEITDNQKAVLNQAQSLSKAIVYQTFASLGGDELAQQTLAYQHLTGHGMKKDCEKALIYYEKSAKSIYEREQAHILYTLSNRHQDVLSKYQIKISDYDDPSIETNAEIDEKAISAERLNFVEMRAIDNPEELVSIGQYYMNGISGVTRNLKKAEEYFLQIHKSHKSYAMAQAFLGKIYIDGGDGIEPDYKKAKEFLDQALMHKSAIAKAYYGTLYLYGWGVEKNLDKAKTFFEDSSKAGWYEASLQLGLNYYNGIFTTNTGATNQVHALKHFKKAAQFGSVIAKYYLGVMFAKGLGAARHCNTAVGFFRDVVENGGSSSIHLWQNAVEHYKNENYNSALIHYLYLADLGYDIAQLNAADIINSGKSKIQDDGSSFLLRAKFNWERAAQEGNSVASRAILNLGDYYFYHEKDYEKAVERYRSNSDRYDCAQSSFNLGHMHHYGIGLSKDYHLAKRYYDKSEQADKSGVIPVFLALSKLLLDMALIKLCNYFTKIEKVNFNFITDFLYAVQIGSIEHTLIKYLGKKYDVILGTVMLFLAGFGLAWRRQNRLLYERNRMDEILRLEQLENSEGEEEGEPSTQNDSLDEDVEIELDEDNANLLDKTREDESNSGNHGAGDAN